MKLVEIAARAASSRAIQVGALSRRNQADNTQQQNIKHSRLRPL